MVLVAPHLLGSALQRADPLLEPELGHCRRQERDPPELGVEKQPGDLRPHEPEHQAREAAPASEIEGVTIGPTRRLGKTQGVVDLWPDRARTEEPPPLRVAQDLLQRLPLSRRQGGHTEITREG
jgi:hypothetical protein